MSYMLEKIYIANSAIFSSKNILIVIKIASIGATISHISSNNIEKIAAIIIIKPPYSCSL
nr:hypothetical protein [uncultured Campylobacter sp.]